MRVGGQNQKGGSEVTDEATSAAAALQMSVVHLSNIRTISNEQGLGFDTVLGGKKTCFSTFLFQKTNQNCSVRMKILYKTALVKNKVRIKDKARYSIQLSLTKLLYLHPRLSSPALHIIYILFPRQSVAPMKAELIINRRMRFTCCTLSAAEVPVQPPRAQCQCALRPAVHDGALSLLPFSRPC